MDASSLTKNDIKDIMQLCYNDTKQAAKIIFPDRFHRDFDDEHDKIFDLLDNSDNPMKVIAAPRGTGKTSIMNLLIPTKRLIYHDNRFVVPVGSTADAAITQSENLKNEFMNNRLLQTVFNIQKTRNFSKKQWTVDISDVQSMIWPRGAGQQVRGMLFRDSRPDLIICDDLEDDEAVRSEEQRSRLKEWFYGALMGTVDRGENNWEILYIDTMKHEDSLLANLLEDDHWDSVTLELCDDDYETKFPNMMSNEDIDELAERYRSQGQMDVFYREFRNIAISTEDAAFQQDMFQYYTNKKGDPAHKEPNFRDQRLFETVIVIDPAKTVKSTSADSALVGGSINLQSGEIFYRDIVSGKYHPDELIDEMLGMITRLRPSVVAVEVTGLNEFVTYPIRSALIKHAPMVQLIELHARGGVNEPGKVARIRSLVPFYRQGLVWHNHANSGGLEAQLMSFPRSKRWDIMDSAAYFVELFERGQRYGATVQDDFDTYQEVQSEWEQLGYTEDEKEPLKLGGI